LEVVKENIDALIKDITTALKARGYTPEEAKQIVGFLNRQFSPNGIIAITSIFTFAKGHDEPISVARILEECEKQWKRNWYYQDPSIKGDPDAPGGAGIQNRASLELIYSAIGVPSPAHEKKA